MPRYDPSSPDAVHLVPPPQFTRAAQVSEEARTEQRTEQEQPQKQKGKIADRLASWPVEPGAPLFVAGAVLACAALGGATGAVIGYRRRLNLFIIGVDMSITWGLGSLAFFSMREYIVTPALIESRVTRAHWQRADELGAGRYSGAPTQCVPWPHTHDPATNATALVAQPPSMSDVRTARLLDSGMAGAAVGTIFAAPKIVANPQDISMRATLRRAGLGLRAGFTGALIALVAQAAVNEGRVVRLKMLAHRAGRAGDAEAEAEADSLQTTAASVPAGDGQTPTPVLCTKNTVGSTTASRTTPAAPVVVPPIVAPITTSTPSTTPTLPAATPEISISDSMSSPLKPQGEGRGDAPLSGKIMGVLASVLPVRRLSDDEYLATLERKRAEVDKRLKEIEGEQWAMFERAEEAEREAEKSG